jgi:hypothetical protein
MSRLPNGMKLSRIGSFPEGDPEDVFPMLYGPSGEVLLGVPVELPNQNFPGVDSESFDYVGSAALPAVGSQATIITFDVPPGFDGIILRFGNVYIGTGFVDFSGALQWQLLADGVPIDFYDDIQASLGATNNPSPVSSIRIKENQTIALVVNNISLVAGGASCAGRIGGFWNPKEREPKGSR